MTDQPKSKPPQVIDELEALINRPTVERTNDEIVRVCKKAQLAIAMLMSPETLHARELAQLVLEFAKRVDANHYADLIYRAGKLLARIDAEREERG